MTRRLGATPGERPGKSGRRVRPQTPGPKPVRPSKPVESVGRHRSRVYCERCGRKRSVCACR